MLIRIVYYIILSSFLFIIYGLFVIKDKVNNLNYQLQEVNRQITIEEDMVHVLKAEFAYLTSPTRLKKFVDKHLGLASVKTTQMIRDPLSTQPESEKVKQIAVLAIPKGKVNVKSTDNNSRHNVNWRYKKAPNKYVQAAYK